MTQPTPDSDRSELRYAERPDVRDPSFDSDMMDTNSPLDKTEITDSDDLGSTDAGLDPLDDSWDPPDRGSVLVRNPSTPAENRQASFDRQLAAEIPDPDPYAEAERRESGAVLEADVYEDESDPTGTLDDAENDRVRSSLVQDDDGTREVDVVAREAGDEPRGETWERSAEEDALHFDRGT